MHRTVSADRALASTADYKVLVINSSQEMAKEITMELTLALPGCSITYAPTLELARWILLRREIDLVVSSSLLPDGGIEKLQDVLHKSLAPPDLVVVGNAKNCRMLEGSGYRLTASRRVGLLQSTSGVRLSVREQAPASMDDPIKSLGADLRNDLNNPLQEIVAMVFVAKTGAASSPGTGQALDAIDKAAKNMAQVVRGLEEKIRAVIAD